MPSVFSSICATTGLIDEQDDVVAVVAVVGIDAELADNFECVFAPVVDVDQRVVKRRAIVARKAVAVAECLGGGEDVGSDDFVQKTLELAVGEFDVIECLEFFAKVPFQGGAVSDVLAIFVLQVNELFDELFFKLVFG